MMTAIKNKRTTILLMQHVNLMKIILPLLCIFSFPAIAASSLPGDTGISAAPLVFRMEKEKDSVLVFSNGYLLDMKRGKFISGKEMVISNGKIIRIRRAGKKLEGRLIDLKGGYVIPGLIDAHVHVTAKYKNNIELTYQHLGYYLSHGITSVRDAAGDGEALQQAKQEILSGKRSGPDVYFASFMAGDWYYNRGIGIRKEPYTPWEQRLMPGDHLDSAMTAAKACGATGVKLYHSFDKDFLKDIVKAARRHGLKVWGHAMMYPAKPIEVVAAGVEVLSHASMLEALSTDSLLNKRSTPKRYKDSVKANVDVRAFSRQMKAHDAIMDATLCVSSENDRWAFNIIRNLHQEGVKISAGTDQIVDLKRPYPRLLDELGYFVKDCGFSTIDAIRAATVISAEVIGEQEHVGTLTAGKKADLLILKGNPLTDINELKNVRMVVKSGKMVPDAH